MIRPNQNDLRSTRRDLEPSDAELLKRFQMGDESAATVLYTRYSRRLREITTSNTSEDLDRRFDADDVVQSVFRSFFRRAGEGYFEVPDGDELWNLLLVMALNKVRRLGKFHRRKKRDVGAAGEIDGADAATPDFAPSKLVELSVAELLDGLSPLHRAVVQLRIQGYTLDEIALETERCSRTVERILARFRDRLSKEFFEGSQSHE